MINSNNILNIFLNIHNKQDYEHKYDKILFMIK